MGRFIAVDFDDVLFPFNETTINKVNNDYGLNIHHLEVHVHGGYTPPEFKGHDIQGLINVLVDTHGPYIDPIPGAKDVLTKLKTSGDKLVVMTARDKRSRENTESWVNYNLPGIFDEVLMLSNPWQNDDPAQVRRKADVCMELGIDYLIDDYPSFTEDAHDMGVNVILFGDYEWNRHVHDKLPHAHNWAEVARILGVQ